MEQVATQEVVWGVCDRFKAENRKVSGRSVLSEVGGSLSTVLQHIKSWKSRDSKVETVAAEIPAELQEAISRALGKAAQDATEMLRQQNEETTTRETEALEALEASELKISSLEKDLASAQAKISELFQLHEKEAAVAAETIAGLREHVSKLEQENDILIRAGEAARTETAKAMMQVERADLAATKAEARAMELDVQIADLLTKKAEAEKGQAVAERHAQDLLEQNGKMETRLEKAGEKIESLESERANLVRSVNAAESAQRKAEGAGEQMERRIQENSALVEQLRKELDEARKSLGLSS